jgi:transposase InsO family protein
MVRGSVRLARVVELSHAGKTRLQWIDWYHRHGEHGRLTCRHFGISTETFYRWLGRYDPRDLRGLEDRSRRPKRVRRPQWSPALAQAVQELRARYPRWGKDKLAVLLREAGWRASVSTVGRILKDLKDRGALKEPVVQAVTAKKRAVQRPYAVRKPKAYQPQEPGDLVEVDTVDLRPEPGVAFKQFTARDVVSRWDVLEARSGATAKGAAAFLESLVERTPFPIRAIQVDGGSEFYADFEKACHLRAIRLFVLPPRSPKLNGHVERANRTHEEEFYELYTGDWRLPPLNRALQEWERVYNFERPHQALGYRTPAQFLLERLGPSASARSIADPDGSAVKAQRPCGRGQNPRALTRPYHRLASGPQERPLERG